MYLRSHHTVQGPPAFLIPYSSLFEAAELREGGGLLASSLWLQPIPMRPPLPHTKDLSQLILGLVPGRLYNS